MYGVCLWVSNPARDGDDHSSDNTTVLCTHIRSTRTHTYTHTQLMHSPVRRMLPADYSVRSAYILRSTCRVPAACSTLANPQRCSMHCISGTDQARFARCVAMSCHVMSCHAMGQCIRDRMVIDSTSIHRKINMTSRNLRQRLDEESHNLICR